MVYEAECAQPDQGRREISQAGECDAEVVVDIGGNEVVSAITRDSAESLNLRPGTPVTVIIKSTEVLVATD